MLRTLIASFALSLASLSACSPEQERQESEALQTLEGEWDQLTDTVSSLYLSGEYSTALPIAKEALRLAEEEFGEYDLDTISSLNTLGALYVELGKYDDAEPLHLRALGASAIAFGEDHPITLESAAFLAALYHNQGLYGEAEPLDKSILEIRTRVLGEDHPETLSSNNGLALLYNHLGRYDEAEAIYLRALDTSERVLGADHSLTLTLVNNLGGLYFDTGRLSEAEPLFIRALETRERRFGDRHPDTLLSVNNLGSLYRELGWYDKAELHYLRALAARESVLGNDHPDTIFSVNNLATVYRESGRFKEADRLFARSLIDSERVLGPTHIARARYISNYAKVIKAQRSSDAVAILLQKQAVNIVQGARTGLSELEKSTQSAFLDKHSYQYETLQKWLIEAGRFAEAEQVGRMLKEQEYFDFVRRRSSNGNDPRRSRSALTTLETEWADQLQTWIDRPNQIALQRAALKTRQRQGETLSDLELTQLADLNTQYQVAYAEYKTQIDTWLASVRDLSDETIQAEARGLEARYHDDLQLELEEMGPDVAALQIVAFDDGVHFFLITPTAFKHIETKITRSSLNEAIFAARRALQPDPGTLLLDPNPNLHLKQLYDILFAPVEQELEDAGTKTLMLNLQGAIRYIPFAALYDGDKYLVERFRLALFTPAARTRFERSKDLKSASGFGVTEAHRIEGLGSFIPLPGVRAEIETLLGTDQTPGIIEGPTYFDGDFTTTSLIEELGHERPIVHIASHFHMWPGNDSNSFLLMGDGSALSLAQINETADLRFRGVELLTLSACSTALSTQGDFDVNSGTGVEVEGFGVLAQRKGAKSVIASLWNVDDDATSMLMSDLYANLASGAMDKSEALRAAQRKLISNPTKRHPYYWAPFILMGNWK